MLTIDNRKGIGQQSRQDDCVLALGIVHGVGFVKHQHERAKQSDGYFFHGFNVTGLVDLEDDCKCVFEHLSG